MRLQWAVLFSLSLLFCSLAHKSSSAYVGFLAMLLVSVSPHLKRPAPSYIVLPLCKPHVLLPVSRMFISRGSLKTQNILENVTKSCLTNVFQKDMWEGSHLVNRESLGFGLGITWPILCTSPSSSVKWGRVRARASRIDVKVKVLIRGFWCTA